MDEADAVATMMDDFWWGFWSERAATDDDQQAAARNPDRMNEPALIAQDAANHLRLKKRHRLLDVGCGPGEVGALLATGCTYYGCDPIPGMVERAERKIAMPRRVFQSDVRALALPPFLPIHRVLVGSVLQYIDRDELPTAMRSVFSAVDRMGGAVLFQAIPHDQHRDAYLEACPAERREANEKATWYGIAEVENAALDAGFLLAERRPLSSLLWQSHYMFNVLAVKTP